MVDPCHQQAATRISEGAPTTTDASGPRYMPSVGILSTLASPKIRRTSIFCLTLQLRVCRGRLHLRRRLGAPRETFSPSLGGHASVNPVRKLSRGLTRRSRRGTVGRLQPAAWA